MGRVRVTQRSSPRKATSPNAFTMYKTFYKSQRNIQVTSPKNKAKKRVELALQYDEEKQYKLAEKELKMKKLNDEAQELLKHKNMLRAMENKKRLDEIKQQNEREINEYAERLKKEKHQLQVWVYLEIRWKSCICNFIIHLTTSKNFWRSFFKIIFLINRYRNSKEEWRRKENS